MFPAHSYGRDYLAICYTGVGTVFSTVKPERRSTSNAKHEREIDYLKKYITENQKCVLCTETEHIL